MRRVDPSNSLSAPPVPRRKLEGLVVGALELYAIDQTSVHPSRVPLEVASKICAEGLPLPLPCYHDHAAAPRKPTAPQLSSPIPRPPSAAAGRAEAQHRIRTETIRWVQQRIEQQLRLRRGEVDFRRRVEAAARRAELPAPTPPPMEPPPQPTAQTEQTEQTEQTAWGGVCAEAEERRPLLDIRAAAPSSRVPPRDASSRRALLESLLHGASSATMLRALLEPPRGVGADAAAIKDGFCVRGLDPRRGGRSGEGQIVGPQVSSFIPAQTELQAMGTEAQNTTEGLDLTSVASRRLVGVPNHNRGLYAALRAKWQLEYEELVKARRMRVRPNAWWSVSGSAEGLAAAANAAGLDVEAYKRLMKRWKVDTQAANWVWPVSSLLSGDEELRHMALLAQRLAHLHADGLLTPDLMARVMNGDPEARQLVNALLASVEDKDMSDAGLSPIRKIKTDGMSFHEMARVLLQERRRKEAEKGDKQMSGERSRSLVDRENYLLDLCSSEVQRDDLLYGTDMNKFLQELPDGSNKFGALPSYWVATSEIPGDSIPRRPSSIRGVNEGEARDIDSRGKGGRSARISSSAGYQVQTSQSGKSTPSNTGRPYRRRRESSGDVLGYSNTLPPWQQDILDETDVPDESESGKRENGARWCGAGPPPRRGQGWRNERTDGSEASEDANDADAPMKNKENGDDLFPFLDRDKRQRARRQQQRQGREEESEESLLPFIEDVASGSVRSAAQSSQHRGVDGHGVENRGTAKPFFPGLGAPRKRGDGTFSSSRSGRSGRFGASLREQRLAKSKQQKQRRRSEGFSSIFDSTLIPHYDLDSDFGSKSAGELSSLFDNDDEELVLFLATFPEAQRHVRLRHEARGILGDLEVSDSLLADYALCTKKAADALPLPFRMPMEKTPPVSVYDAEKDPSDDEAMQANFNFAALRERFESEAREEYAELWQTVLEMRQRVAEQTELLDRCKDDLHNITFPELGEDCDAFALRLTQEVNLYAQSHRLDLRQLSQRNGSPDSYAEAVRAFLENFALTRGRLSGRDVGCQCSPEDLGYVDSDAVRTEEQMEDLYYHSRQLQRAIKLIIASVGNVMGFHAFLEMESTCRRCFCIFENPRTLWPCGHTFCHSCLADMFHGEELICDECGSICDVGYTPNLAVELVASYQVMNRNADNDDEKVTTTLTHQRTIESVLATLMRDLKSTQNTYVESPRATRKSILSPFAS